MLYVRMFALMLVGLYASRVVLAALGENDYGVYNVIGGVVSMFTIISGALNSAVQRFITYEMGKGAQAQLNKVYSSAVIIQLALALVIVALAEPVPDSGGPHGPALLSAGIYREPDERAADGLDNSP